MELIKTNQNRICTNVNIVWLRLLKRLKLFDPTCRCSAIVIKVGNYVSIRLKCNISDQTSLAIWRIHYMMYYALEGVGTINVQKTHIQVHTTHYSTTFSCSNKWKGVARGQHNFFLYALNVSSLHIFRNAGLNEHMIA